MRTTVTLDPDADAIVRQVMHDRHMSFKQALNEVIRSSRGRGKRGLVRTRTFDMGPARFPIDKAIRIAAELEDDEILRELAARR